MDGQYASSGFQLYGQPLQTGVQQSGQGLTQGATAQQLGGYAFIPAAGAGQPALANLRPQAVQILQQPAATPQTKQQQQTGLGAVGFQTQPTQNQQQQQQQPPQQQRLQAAQMPTLTNQQLQYFQAAQQQGSQLGTTQFQTYSQAPQQPQLGAIQILQPKAQQGSVVGRTFQQQQGQSTMQGMQVLPQAQAQAQPQPQQQATPQPIQAGQSIQGMQGLLQVPGLQPTPGVQVLQQYPGFTPQVTNQSQQPKQANLTGSGFSSAGHQQSVGAGGPGTGGVHHTGSLFSNSNQRGNYGQGRYNWTDRDRNDRSDFRGRPRDRARREDRGSFGSRMPTREPPARMSRDREPIRPDRSNRDRYDRGNFRDANRREKDFSKERERKPSPAVHHHYDFKKEDFRKEPRREIPAKPLDLAAAKDFKTAPQHVPLVPKPPPVADYQVKVPQAPFATYERDYSDVARRYTHLHISPDFTKLICCWAKHPTTKRHPYGCSLCPLNVPLKFEMIQGPHEAEEEIVLPASKNETKTSIRWNAKCTFICGLDGKVYGDILKGKFEGGNHLMNTLKFVTIREEKDRKRTGIMCLGGPYDPELDGGNPEQDSEGLKQACVRHVKAQTLLDLTPCTSWIRFCDIHYDRRDLDGHQCEEVTVIFLVDVSVIFPSEEDWPAIWREQKEWKHKTAVADIMQMADANPTADVPQQSETQTPEKDTTAEIVKPEESQTAPSLQESEDKDEKMEDVPKEVSLLMKCRSAKNGRVKTMSISLDGLLDYDEGDKDEGTFELSLLAEGFNEMLMRDYGLLILNALMEQKRTAAAITVDQKPDDKKRPTPLLSHEVPEPLIKKPKQTADTSLTTEDMMTEETPLHEDTATPEAPAVAEDTEMPSQESPGDIVHVGDSEHQQQQAQSQDQPEVTMQDVTPAPIDAAAAPDQAEDDTGDVDKDMNDAESVEMKDVAAAVDASEPPATTAADVVVDEELLFAFRYFDRAGCGYIKCDDLRRLLHNLGCCLAPRMVRDLVNEAAAMNKEKHDRVCYRSLTDKESPASN